jgi:ribulose-5-phosphate 4-epimerase/fuculose-1-phosphate aldolase
MCDEQLHIICILSQIAELEGPEGMDACAEAPMSWFADSQYILNQLSEGARTSLSEEPGVQRRCCDGEEEQYLTMRPITGQGWVSWNVHDWVNSTTPTAENVLAAVDSFEKVSQEESTVLQIPLRPGTGALVDNFRVMHGRGAMGPMRRLIVGFEAPNAPVEAAWASLRYPTTTSKLGGNVGLQTRVELAAGLRLLHHNGQSDLLAGLFAARHPTDPSLFYAADHSMFWEEASPEHFQLYSVETGERVQESGREMREDKWPNAPVIPIARALFGNFSHINSIIHAHGPNAMSLAAAENNEVLPISEHGFMFYERVGYVRCDFFFGNDYIAELVEGLKEPEVFVLQMRNHAYLMTGPTVRHTYLRAHMFEKACEVQLKVMASGSPPHVPGKEELEYHRSSYEGFPGCPAYVGDHEWPGFMRQLERIDPGWATRGLSN